MEPRQNQNLRFETKYRISLSQYCKIKSGLIPFVRKDQFTDLSKENTYLVRSLYFDSSSHRSYVEKMTGNADRVKYRIRTYDDNIENQPDVRVEMKIRQGDLTKKYNTFVDIPTCQHFLRVNHWPEYTDNVLIEFERQIHKKTLYPKLLVEYRREGYETLDGEKVRITFDHAIRSSSASDLFPENVFWHDHREQMIVLEIKHFGKISRWLNNVIRGNGLRPIANSKFALGTEASQHDLTHPAWSKN